MTYFVRLWPRLVILLALLIAPIAHASAQEPLLGINMPSTSGSFLAGQQAFKELRTDDASRYFLDASEADWENPVIVERAFVALAADGRVDDAAALAQHLIELDPENEMARLVLGTVALKERRYSSAIKQLEGVQNGSFVGITAAIVRGWALVGNKDYPASEVLMDELGRSGLDDFLVFHRALMADVAGEREVAISYSTQAYNSDPYVARIVEAQMRMLANASRFDEAKAIYKTYADEGLSHPLVVAVAQSVNAGVRPGKIAATVQAGTAEMYHGIGAALAREGTNDIAVVFLQLGLYLDPHADIIAMALSNLFENAGRYDVANSIYEAMPADSPMKSTAIVRVAENIDATGDRDEAIRRLGNIATTQPDNLDAVSVLGDMLRYAERYEEAVAAYTKALVIVGGGHPRDWRFYYVRGIANERADHWPAAEADFLRALELNPGHPQILNYLGYSWVDKGMHLQRALGMIREAVEASPTDGYIVDSLGWAYYKLGRIEEAVQSLEQAVQLRPNDPEINDHLGDAYWKAGRKLEARFQWTVAIDVDEDGVVTERAEPKLAGGLDAVDAQ